MFIIKNVSKREIDIPQLRIFLGPNEQIDLDMISSRFYTDQCSMLKSLVGGGVIKVLAKDDHSGTFQIKTAEVDQRTHVTITPPADNRDVLDAVKKLEEKLSRRLDDKIAAQSQQPQVDMQALTQALTALQSIVSQQAGKVEEKPKIEAVEIQDSRMVDVHKRTLDRLAGNAKSNVKHTEQISDNKHVKKNMDELEGLL